MIFFAFLILYRFDQILRQDINLNIKEFSKHFTSALN